MAQAAMHALRTAGLCARLRGLARASAEARQRSAGLQQGVRDRADHRYAIAGVAARTLLSRVRVFALSRFPSFPFLAPLWQ